MKSMNHQLKELAAQLQGRVLPAIALPSTRGGTINLVKIPNSFVLFIYPRTGRPDTTESSEWSIIPGAKGCTAETCEFRDLAADYAAHGYGLYGLSSQDTEYQSEASARLHLPYSLLSDVALTVAESLNLPTFESEGERLYVRSTLVIQAGVIAEAFLGIENAADHPRQLLAEL